MLLKSNNTVIMAADGAGVVATASILAALGPAGETA